MRSGRLHVVRQPWGLPTRSGWDRIFLSAFLLSGNHLDDGKESGNSGHNRTTQKPKGTVEVGSKLCQSGTQIGQSSLQVCFGGKTTGLLGVSLLKGCHDGGGLSPVEAGILEFLQWCKPLSLVALVEEG